VAENRTLAGIQAGCSSINCPQGQKTNRKLPDRIWGSTEKVGVLCGSTGSAWTKSTACRSCRACPRFVQEVLGWSHELQNQAIQVKVNYTQPKYQ
jgi:dissimilatory sulfite reductase (desulfoviridin) alpha/beta subunit